MANNGGLLHTKSQRVAESEAFSSDDGVPFEDYWKSTGNLTVSGVLYEGNLADWRERIDNLLKVHGVNINKVSRPVYRDGSGIEQRQHAIKLITDQISPALLRRIPARDLICPQRLLCSVREMAKPFRLNDLPQELRDRVYGWHFANTLFDTFDEGSWNSHTLLGFLDMKYDFYPKALELLLVSHSTRAQALPFYYKTLVVMLHGHGDGIEEEDGVEEGDSNKEEEFSGPDQVRSWAEKQSGRCARFLRKITAQHLYKIGTSLTIELKDRIGLVARYRKDFPSDQQQAWEEHVANIEKDRKAFGLQGEALALCFTSKPELWREA
ncbi:hypothetical protein LTR49_028701 [Elasticomyces elasticus]|nr:hypothetical protein LTR49_028701 [Elasticomyces elasticus]